MSYQNYRAKKDIAHVYALLLPLGRDQTSYAKLPQTQSGAKLLAHTQSVLMALLCFQEILNESIYLFFNIYHPYIPFLLTPYSKRTNKTTHKKTIQPLSPNKVLYVLNQGSVEPNCVCTFDARE